MNNDLSDKAFWDWCKSTNQFPVVLAGWQECRRRSREKLAEWMIDHGIATGHGDDMDDLLKQFEWQLQERERHAFEAGLAMSYYSDKTMNEHEVQEAWRSYKGI